MPKQIVKRDGRTVPYDKGRIFNSVAKCFRSLGIENFELCTDITDRVHAVVENKYETPAVEQVQDVVEMVLLSTNQYQAAKAYILYRAEKAKIRNERPTPARVREAFEESSKFFPTPLQEFQFYDKYSRFNYSLGRRETWVETVDRVVDHLYWLAGSRIPHDDYDLIRRYISEMKAFPSMRLLAMAGEAAKRNPISQYNCSSCGIDSIDAFVETLRISFAGCGVGISVESRYVDELPRVKRQRGCPPDLLVVEDSSEGWEDALRFGLTRWFDGNDAKFDLSRIRPAGTPLRTKGGRASGHEPLRQLLDFARQRILARQGKYLRTLDAHDIACAIGNASIAGATRRTAIISLFDFDDTEMALCKTGDFERGNSQRWNANNSRVWLTSDIDQTTFIEHFMDMVKDGRGEPGIFNRDAVTVMRPARRKKSDFLVNPCVTADTWVLTDNGARQVHELVGNRFNAVVDNEAYPSTPGGYWSTGIRSILKLTTEEGYGVRLTGNHRVLTLAGQNLAEEWIAASQLRPGDKVRLHKHIASPWSSFDCGSYTEGWLVGSLVGFGNIEDGVISFSRRHMEDRPYANYILAAIHDQDSGMPSQDGDIAFGNSSYLREIATKYGLSSNSCGVTHQIEKAPTQTCIGFLAGVFGIPEIDKQANQIILRSRNAAVDLLKAAQRMLLNIGVASSLRSENSPCLVVTGGHIRTFYRLVGYWEPEIHNRLREIAYSNPPVMERHDFVATVKSVEPDGQEEVFDCAIPDINAFDANGVYVHNCGEVVLRNMSFCNLSSAIARGHDTEESLAEKVRVATIIGTIQSLATDFQRLRPQWKKNCEEERLLGVDITGQRDSLVAQDGDVKARLRQRVLGTNREYAAKLGINPSASTTCVKPSGNTSQLADCSSGLHARWAPYYIRNVRVSVYSPVYKVLKDAGVPMHPENGQTFEAAHTWVAHFPVKAPEGTKTRLDLTAIEQCDFWLQNKLQWTEHNPSCFSGDTQFITDKGLRRFDSCADGERAQVLNARGQWAIATVQHHGIQPIWEITVERAGHRRVIRTTANHVWPYTFSDLDAADRPTGYGLHTTATLRNNPHSCVELVTVSLGSALGTSSTRYRVTRIEPTSQRESVYCVEEPVGGYFVLEGDILTHNCTVTYRPDEVVDLMKWVWDHRHQIGGLSFLPTSDARYSQMPYDEITREEYERLAAVFPPIDWSKLYRYEYDDMSTASSEVACQSGACDWMGANKEVENPHI